MEKKLLEANEAIKNKKYDEAIFIYEEILKANDVAEIHFNLGLVLKIQNKLDAAEASFSKAISLKSAFVLAHYQLGNTKFKLNKFDEFLAEKRITLARVDLVLKCKRILRAKRYRGKYKEQSCTSYKIDNYNINKDHLIIEGEAQEIDERTITHETT